MRILDIVYGLECSLHWLVHLDSAVYPPYERIRGQEADGTREQAIHKTSQEAVGEEQHGADEAGDMKYVEVVIHAVGEDPDAGCTAEEERLPPPVVVLQDGLAKLTLLYVVDSYLRTKLNVDSDDSRLHHRQY